METLGNKIMPKLCPKFYCKYCDYGTCKKSSFDNHLLSSKHKKWHNGNIVSEHGNQNMPNVGIHSSKYSCQTCNKEFKHRSGLWKHNKICKEIPVQTNAPTYSKDEVYELLKYLMTENSELKSMMIEQQTKMMEQQNLVLEIAKNGTTSHSHNTNTNSHNKTFNLQFFLNETCKNAMNIEDFVNDIVLTLKDLEETGRLGFAEGISKIITSRLKTLDVTERPFHCSDIKRETLYVKDENKWEKEEETKPILTKAVKNIAGKNMMQLFEWQKEHPEYKDPETKTSEKYMKMVTNVMSGGTEEETNTNYDKILKSLLKEATIKKEQFSV